MATAYVYVQQDGNMTLISLMEGSSKKITLGLKDNQFKVGDYSTTPNWVDIGASYSLNTWYKVGFYWTG